MILEVLLKLYNVHQMKKELINEMILIYVKSVSFSYFFLKKKLRILNSIDSY